MTPYDTIMEWYDRLQVFQRCPEADVFLRCFLEVLKNAEDQGLATLPDFLAHWQEKGGEEKSPHARRHRRRAHHDRPQESKGLEALWSSCPGPTLP